MTWHAIVIQIERMALGMGFGGLVLAPFIAFIKREAGRMLHQQRRMADSLDPEKPGGVTEMLDRIEHREAK